MRSKQNRIGFSVQLSVREKKQWASWPLHPKTSRHRQSSINPRQQTTRQRHENEQDDVERPDTDRELLIEALYLLLFFVFFVLFSLSVCVHHCTVRLIVPTTFHLTKARFIRTLTGGIRHCLIHGRLIHIPETDRDNGDFATE